MKRKALSGTLTIRLASPLRRKLVRRAKEEGVSPSELARLALESALADQPEAGPSLGERTATLLGSIASKSAPAGRDARKALEGWAPDRRG